MGVCEIITIILAISKVTHNADISWWQVFIPEYISAFLSTLCFIVVLAFKEF